MTRVMDQDKLVPADVSDTKACINCGSLIPINARICATCKSYQSQWRNTLVYLGVIAGAITLGGSALLFTGSKAYDLYIKSSWNEQFSLQLLKWPGEALVSNPGGNDIFIATLEFYWMTGANQQVSINQFLKPGEVRLVPLEYIEDRDSREPVPVPPDLSHAFWLSNESGKPSCNYSPPFFLMAGS